MINQKKIELELSGILERGDIARISEVGGIGYSYLESQLNPNDPRISGFFSGLKFLCDYRQVSNERALLAKQIFDREFELAAPVVELNLCLNHETGRLSKEVNDLVIKTLDGCSAEEKMKELIEVEQQLKQTRFALINEYSQNGAKV